VKSFFITPKMTINQYVIQDSSTNHSKTIGKKYNVPPPIGVRLKQYQIGTGGSITPPEVRHLLSLIDTIEFTKWELKTID